MQRSSTSQIILQLKHFVLSIVLLVSVTCMLASSLIYSDGNSIKIFEAFKEKYNKVYENINEEQGRYKNFVKNLNKVTKLNEVVKDNTTFFVVNQYADLNPEDIEEHYAVFVKPYNNISMTTKIKMIGRNKPREIDFTRMYDLYNAHELFKQYIKKHNRNLTDNYDRSVHYYRFIKTLVEINRKQFKEDDSNKNMQLGDTADIVKEPKEYFY